MGSISLSPETCNLHRDGQLDVSVRLRKIDTENLPKDFGHICTGPHIAACSQPGDAGLNVSSLSPGPFSGLCARAEEAQMTLAPIRVSAWT